MWSKTYIGLHVRYPLFLSDFNETLAFSTDFSKNIQIQNFMKILPVGAELFHADRRTYERIDRQTDRHDECNSRFLQFCERV